MKLKVFLWQIFHNKLQTGVKLKKKGSGGGVKSATYVRRQKQWITFSFRVCWLNLFGSVSKKLWVGIENLLVGKTF